MLRFLFLFFLLLFSFRFSPAQNSSPDSMENVLTKMRDDSSKVDLLNTTSWVYITTDITKAKFYCEQSIALAEKLNFRKGLSRGYILMSNIFFDLGNYEKCLTYNLKGLKLREELNDEHGVAGALGNIGSVYEKMRQVDKALEYHQKSLDKFKELYARKPNDDDAFDIGVSLLSIGDICKVQKKYVEAMKSFQEALWFFKKLTYNPNIASCYSEIGEVYFQMNDSKHAEEYYSKALVIFNHYGNKQGLSNVYYNLAELSFKSHDYEKAIQYADKSLVAAKEIEMKDNVKSAYELLSHVYAQKGNFEKAYSYHTFFSDTKDSLLNGELSKQLTEMQTKYETEKKEQEIILLNKDNELQDEQLNRQRIIIWLVAAGLLLVFILSLFILKERRKSEKLLLNILPAETAKELKEKGKASPRHYESVTVMFTDFKGFTSIAEKLSAEELVSELDFIFKKFDEIISRYPIEKIKTMGDAYMCASGLPSVNLIHATTIVMAALEIQTWMKAQNNRWDLRIGIHTGPVTAGVVGDKKFAYDIWGDTVNIASRMESSGEAGKVNISGSTYELVKDKFTSSGSSSHLLQKKMGSGEIIFTHRGKIMAKNKGEIDMYFVERN